MSRYISSLRIIQTGFLLAFLVAETGAQAQTVTDAVFRARWVGPQAPATPSGPELPIEESLLLTPDLATKLREGLWKGPLRIRPGLGSGWSYSNRNWSGQSTTASDDQSVYFAPSLGLEYEKEAGPWLVEARAGGGYVYFVNQNYNPSGTGGNRNPYHATVSLRLGHVGLRHEANVSGSASYGNGQNVLGGGDAVQFRSSLGFDYDYVITEFLSSGLYGEYKTLLTQFQQGGLSGSDLSELRGGAFLNSLWSGKTTLGFKAETGRLTQQIQQQQGNDSGGDARQYVQLLATGKYNLTSKVVLSAGGGVGYTEDVNVTNAASGYSGLRPVYNASVDYSPSEKTSVGLYYQLEGFDIVPSYGCRLMWRPRQTTAISLSLYQNQNFSITTRNQFQVYRGFVAGVEQALFSRLFLGVSGGWQLTENISLSQDAATGQSYPYSFVSATLRYAINSWASWQASLYTTSGNRAQPNSTGTFPQSTANVGLNLQL
jgi:hypothetical protein